MKPRDRVIVAILVTLCVGLVAYRIARMRAGGHDGAVPQRHYEVILDMRMHGHGDDVAVRAYLPLDDDRQSIRDEMVSSGSFAFSLEREDGNRRGVWTREAASGTYTLVYSTTVHTRGQRYDLAPEIPLPERYPAEVARWLLPSERIQSDEPEIQALLDRLVAPQDRANAITILRAIYDYTSSTIKPADFQGNTDAMTCLRLGESSCGGKSRLFAALARAAGLPARLVGGLILRDGTWRAQHVWAEVWIAGHWVPFCPLNGYFAEIPDRYLTTYVGDLPHFLHSRDISFRYAFTARRILAPPRDWIVAGWTRHLQGPNLWAAFEQVRIPVNLLKIILMVPFGALAVVVFRNVVGIETFGTFMPALIAVACRDTGLLWGIVLLAFILGVGAAVRLGLERFQLLHTPRLAVILTVIVILLLAITLAGLLTGFVLPTRVSLFPLAILTLTAERFATMLEVDGSRRAAIVSLGTLVVMAAAYAVMNWERLQVAVLAFPELLLMVLAAFFVVGRWSGMRLFEYVRFRDMLPSRGGA